MYKNTSRGSTIIAALVQDITVWNSSSVYSPQAVKLNVQTLFKLDITKGSTFQQQQQKRRFCHHVFIFMSFQNRITCFLQQNTRYLEEWVSSFHRRKSFWNYKKKKKKGGKLALYREGHCYFRQYLIGQTLVHTPECNMSHKYFPIVFLEEK